MSRIIIALCILIVSSSCAPQQEELLPPPCVWDAELTDEMSDTRTRYLLGPVDVSHKGQGVQCRILPIIRDAALFESALLFCKYDNSRFIFSAEVQVDPRSYQPIERKKEFVFRRGMHEPLRVMLACK